MAFDGFAEWSQAGRARREVTVCVAELQRQAEVLAHDINNLLGVVLAANEALAAHLPEGSMGHELACMSLDAAERGAALLRRMSDLAHADEGPRALVDGGEAIRATARLFEASADEGVVVATATGLEPLCIVADRAGLDAALLNLCVNAGHAMPVGGTITLSAQPVVMDAAAAAGVGLPAGRYVALAVADTGVGMSREILSRACEPWFTTRADRGGTGLGLASVQDFAIKAGGALGLASARGVGTTATLYLPRV